MARGARLRPIQTSPGVPLFMYLPCSMVHSHLSHSIWSSRAMLTVLYDEYSMGGDFDLPTCKCL